MTLIDSFWSSNYLLFVANAASGGPLVCCFVQGSGIWLITVRWCEWPAWLTSVGGAKQVPCGWTILNEVRHSNRQMTSIWLIRSPIPAVCWLPGREMTHLQSSAVPAYYAVTWRHRHLIHADTNFVSVFLWFVDDSRERIFFFSILFLFFCATTVNEVNHYENSQCWLFSESMKTLRSKWYFRCLTPILLQNFNQNFTLETKFL